MAKAQPRRRVSPIDPYAGKKGEIAFAFDWKGAYQRVVIVGGPFDSFPVTEPDAFGICVRSERVPSVGVDVHVPIRDFNVPTPDQHDLVASAVLTAFEAAFVGRTVWVGCMGGMGRTGLFLAIMAKCAGIKDPVMYVRQHYYSHAVETDDQYRYVESFDVSVVQEKIYARAWRHQVKGLFRDVYGAFRLRFPF